MTHADIITFNNDGSVAISGDLTKRFKGGEILVVVKNDDKLVLEEVDPIDVYFLEDLEFMRRTREAWRRYENGEFKSLPLADFLVEMRKW